MVREVLRAQPQGAPDPIPFFTRIVAASTVNFALELGVSAHEGFVSMVETNVGQLILGFASPDDGEMMKFIRVMVPKAVKPPEPVLSGTAGLLRDILTERESVAVWNGPNNTFFRVTDSTKLLRHSCEIHRTLPDSIPAALERPVRKGIARQCRGRREMGLMKAAVVTQNPAKPQWSEG